MKIKILGASGLHASEVRAVERMEAQLRDSWFAYASLLVADDQGSMDLDTLVITHDRLLLVELKEWNGEIESSDGRWYLNGVPYGKSPYEIKRVHAIRLTRLLQQELQHKLGYFPIVEAHVVLCGSATPERLSTTEKRFVHTLDEFLEISDRASYERLVEDHSNIVFGLFERGGKPRPNSDSCLPLFKEFFGGSRVKPKEFKAFHYVADPVPWFEHRNHLYREYKGYHEETINDLALMRRWDFTQLGIGSATQKQWADIALRESRVISHAKQRSSTLEEYMLRPIVPLGVSDITEDVTELYELRRTYSRLDEFINGENRQAGPEVRLDWVRALLVPFAELHGLGIGHRDIDLHSLWYASEQRSIVMSGLGAAFYPERGTIRDLRQYLQGTDIKLPEDAMSAEGDILDPFRQDVFMLAVVAYRLCFPQSRLEYETKIPKWKPPTEDPYEGTLNAWFQKALEWDPKERYTTANEQLAAFNELTRRQEHEGDDSSVVLAALSSGNFIKRGWSLFTLYQEFPPLPGENPGAGLKLAYRCTHGDGEAYCKIWHKVSIDPGLPGLNRRVSSFRARVEKVIEGDLPTPAVLDFGLLETGGLYLVTRLEPGKVWNDAVEGLEGTERLKLALALVKSAKRCHEQGVAHGDIHPANVLVTGADLGDLEAGGAEGFPGVVLLDLLDFGEASEPYNIEYGPTNPAAADAMGRDRHAAYKIVRELLTPGMVDSTPIEELDRGLSQPNGVPVSLDPLEQSLVEALTPKGEAEASSTHLSPLHITWKSRFFPTMPSQLAQDSGVYYFNCRWDRRDSTLLNCYITGVNASLTIALDPEGRQIKDIRFSSEIPLSDLVSASSKATATIDRPITVCEGSLGSTSASDAVELLLALDPVISLLEERYSPEDRDTESDRDDAETPDTGIPVRRLWTALVATEDEILAAVEVDSGDVSESKSGRIMVPYRVVGGGALDFDSDDRVFVTIDGDDASLGDLDINETTPDLLAINPTRARMRNALTEGMVLKLESIQNKASRDRKAKALERVLDRASTIPHLADYFDRTTAPRIEEFSSPPTETLLRELYDSEEQRLNSKQIEAFQKLVSEGPVGVLQGPPGTGKTAFVANFVHYLFQELNVRNVLLVGQSHTSVDAVAGKAREVCRKKGLEPSVVRMGHERMISTDMLDAHSRALQRQMRHAFHRQYDQRLKVFSARFGLPDALIDEVAVVHRALAPLVSSLCYYNSEIERLQKRKSESSVDAEREEDVITQRDSVQDLVEKIIFQRYPDLASSLAALADPWAGVLQHLCRMHGVSNPAAVHRLSSLLGLSREWLEVLGTGGAHYDQFLVQTRQLVCGTLVGMGHKQYGVADAKFDWVIVDEAARAQASELMVPLQSAKRALLVGDHKQLPPLYAESHLKAAARHLGADMSVFATTDFERAFHVTGGVTLDTQYRMAKPIGDLVSHCFYREVGSLSTGRDPSPAWYASLDHPWNFPVVWVDSGAGEHATGEEEIGQGRYVNPHEAQIILSLLKRLADREVLSSLRNSLESVGGHAIGIITMYRAQKELLEKELSKAEWAAPLRDLVKIGTVDSYQGQENKIILLSLVRDNASGRQGFLTDRARINVSISRAQERLVLVGAKRMWSGRNGGSPLGDVLSFVSSRSEVGDPNYGIVAGNESDQSAVGAGKEGLVHA